MKLLWVSMLSYYAFVGTKAEPGRIELNSNPKKQATHENRQICHRSSHRTEDQPRRARYPPPKAKFSFEIRNLGVLADSCQLFKGGTTGFHHDAARNFAGRDLHTSARTSESFGRSESGSHEPDHQSAQSAAVAAQRRRGANFRSTDRVRASNDHCQTCEIEHKQRIRRRPLRNPLSRARSLWQQISD